MLVLDVYKRQALKNGNAIPVTGIKPVTTAIFIITCIPIKVVIPTANKLPKLSGARIAVSIPLQIKTANNAIIAKHPIKPSSSATIENIKSFCGSDMYKNFCLLSPKSYSKKAS